jgi:hypothetical protein
MVRKIRRGVSALMLVLLLLPLIAKLEHHHKHNSYQEGNKTNQTWLREHCAICNLECSLFIFDEPLSASVRAEYSDFYINRHKPAYYHVFSYYTFLLRAPPLFTISIT